MTHPVGKVPAGGHRGKHPLDLSVGQLEDAVSFVDAKLCRDNKYKDAPAHKRWLRGATRLLQRRKFPTGSYDETDAANRALRDAAEVGHLLSPNDQVARVLDGTAIVIGAFRADILLDTFADDEMPWRRIPGKALLDRVANGLGISWDASLCKRIDSGKHPYVRAAQAAGRIKNFDGTDRQFQAMGEIDLMNGSALANAIEARFRDRGRVEIERRRQHIGSHADTIARLRAIRQLGLRDSYLPTELEKPFFLARVQFTGRSENAATQQVFVERVADTFLPAASALFGAPKRAAEGR